MRSPTTVTRTVTRTVQNHPASDLLRPAAVGPVARMGAVVLLVAAAVAPVLAHGADGRALLRRVPASRSATLLVGVDFQALRGARLFRQVLAAARKSEGNRGLQLLERAGFDPEKDLDTLVLQMDASGGGQAARAGEVLLLLEGRFDRRRILTASEAEGARMTRSERHGVPLYRYRHRHPEMRGEDLAMAFLPGTLLLGSRLTVERAVDLGSRGEGGESLVSDGATMALVDRVAAAGGAWFVFRPAASAAAVMGAAAAAERGARGPLAGGGAGGGAGGASPLALGADVNPWAAAEAVVGSLRVGDDGVAVDITAVCRDAGAAAGMQQAATMVLSAMRVGQPVLAEVLLDRARLSVAGREMKASVALPAATLERLAALLVAPASPGGAPPATDRAASPADGKVRVGEGAAAAGEAGNGQGKGQGMAKAKGNAGGKTRAAGKVPGGTPPPPAGGSQP